jgi:class 3 adenylate cyclase
MSLTGATSDLISSALNFVQAKFYEWKISIDMRRQASEARRAILIQERQPIFQIEANSEPRYDDIESEEVLSEAMGRLALEHGPRPQCIEVLKTFKEPIFLFADMESYSLRTKKMKTEDLARLLNTIYTEFERIVHEQGRSCGIEVVKVTGDCIMLSAHSRPAALSLSDQAKAMVKVGWALMSFIIEFNKARSDDPVNFRFGINVGPAAKVLITHTGSDDLPKRTIDWLGEGVNFAARMESSSLPNQIQLSEKMHLLVSDEFHCSKCKHEVKSYGKTETFFIVHPLKRRQSKEDIDRSEKRASSGQHLRKVSAEMGSISAPALRKSMDGEEEQKLYCILHPLKRSASKDDLLPPAEGVSSAPVLRKSSKSNSND